MNEKQTKAFLAAVQQEPDPVVAFQLTLGVELVPTQVEDLRAESLVELDALTKRNLLNARAWPRQAVYAFEAMGLSWLRWAEKAHDPSRLPYPAFADHILREAWTRFLTNVFRKSENHAIDDALHDQMLRDQVSRNYNDKKVWKTFQSYWTWRLGVIFRMQGFMWRVPGFSEDELVEQLVTDAYVDISKNGLRELEPQIPAHVQVTFIHMSRLKDKLRRRSKRLTLIPDGYSEPYTVLPPATPEEIYLRDEREQVIAAILDGARSMLSKKQQMWLATVEEYLKDSPDAEINAAELARLGVRKYLEEAT